MKTGKNHKVSKTTTSQWEGNQGVKNCKNGSIVEMSNWGVKEKQFVFFRPHIPPSYTPHYTLHPAYALLAWTAHLYRSPPLIYTRTAGRNIRPTIVPPIGRQLLLSVASIVALLLSPIFPVWPYYAQYSYCGHVYPVSIYLVGMQLQTQSQELMSSLALQNCSFH